MDCDSDSDLDSLFDEIFPEDTQKDASPFSSCTPNTSHSHTPPDGASTCLNLARITVPSIQGLYFDPSIFIPPQCAADLMQNCMTQYFSKGNVNQVMLFERALHDFTSLSTSGGSVSTTTEPNSADSGSKLPQFLTSFLQVLSVLLRPLLPNATHALLFPSPNTPPQARQVIINHYLPGEGITPHVDLLDRFGDGIIGVSLGSGCVMRFRKVRGTTVPDYHDRAGGTGDGDGGDVKGAAEDVEDVYLPPGSVYVMSGEARYRWTHEIEGRKADLIQEHLGDETGIWTDRSIRVSITFRWLLPGADVVGVPATNE
ncbi:unnamed protein product [Somion occarium]|uniref:Fe2OG dioxygenase domain-containing protein n=1 Tax=Somion occarium TaxID=3059160 RepID=A0ABP1CZ01_9APHY